MLNHHVAIGQSPAPKAITQRVCSAIEQSPAPQAIAIEAKSELISGLIGLNLSAIEQ